ncbi:flagellar hook-length control protein FliK [Shimia sp. R9_2]|uniref:flagellar hook-length control protein FliK n=1 Tax=Shimia sp. R9_2 TaxID=2821112 RepID=UPI001ADC84F0|nr:flagellar hook-length control protein FliK [Shimia sp. R9_2]MBO9395403.1 flagellar hook-length control protein FliK [Shimia sp. R9_2]
MLNLPLLAPQPAHTAAVAPKKSADARQENNGFSDVYDDMDRTNERPSDDLQELREARSDQTEDAPVEGESQVKQSKSNSEKEAPEEADFAAIETAEQSEAEPEVPMRGVEKRAAVNASENAAMMRMAHPAEGAAAPAKAEASTTTAQAQATATAAKPLIDETKIAATAKSGETVQLSESQAAKLAAETPEGLDPMQVQVRNKGTQPSQAQAANAALAAAQKALPEAASESAATRNPVKSVVEVEADAEAPTAKLDAPSTPTVSTTQQMQARAIMEQVQAGAQSVLAKGGEANVGQAAESALPAALEENSISPRGIMSAQEAASQARLANSAPNPAYVVRQIADAVKTSDKNLIELTMDPPELGKVRMSMAETGGVMAVTISADSQATTELMRRHMDLLRKDFMEMGYQDVSFSFEQGGSDASGQQAQMNNEFGPGGGGQGESSHGGSAQTDAAPVLAAQQTSQLSAASSGVDIRI